VLSYKNPYAAQSIRRNLPYFLFGRAANGFLNFTCFILAARLLPTTEYGYYVAAIAAMELALYVSSFGLEWPSLLLIPRFGRDGTAKQLVGFVKRLAVVQGLGHACAAVLLLVTADLIARWMAVPGMATTLQYFGAVVFFEGCSRMVRDQFLGALLSQRAAQGSQFVRNAAMLAFLAYALWSGSEWTAAELALAEVLGACLSLTAGITALRQALAAATRGMSSPERTSVPVPSWGEARRMARNGYLSSLCTVAYGSQVLTLMITAFTGAQGAALYGFSRTLVEQFAKYMPASLFLGMARPLLAVRFAETNDPRRLASDSSLYFRLSITVAIPVVLFFAAFSYVALPFLSSRGASGAEAIVPVLAFWLLPASFRRVIDSTAAILGRSSLSVRSNLMLAICPFIAAALLMHDTPLQRVALIPVISETTYGVLMMAALQREKLAFFGSWRSAIHAVAWSPLLVIGLSYLDVPDGLWGLAMAVGVSVGSGAALLGLTKVISASDLRMLARLRHTSASR
jgi:O-antigen/teichoic acid export membrane protein